MGEKDVKINVQKEVDLKGHTAFDVGGTAKCFCEVSSEKEIINAIGESKRAKLPFFILAGGNNVVFGDKEYEGFVIKIKGGEINVKGEKIHCDAGVPLASLIKTSIENGLSGLETLSGIPGTVGGAIYGNAGAYGHSISNVVSFVSFFTGKKKQKFFKKDCGFGYRESIFKKKKGVILGALFKFKKGKKRYLEKISRNIIEARNSKFSFDIKCPGSYFKNVLVSDTSKKSLKLIGEKKIVDGKIPAGLLLESIGAKGMRVGDVAVADFHGNLIINVGNAKFRDVAALVKKLKSLVYKKFGIKLKEEVQYCLF